MRDISRQFKGVEQDRNGRGQVPAVQSSWWSVLIFSGGFLVLGMLDAFLSVIFLWGGTLEKTDLKYPPIYPPDWVFWAVWVIIYPTWGVATWLVWKRRAEVNLQGFTIFVTLNFLANLAFMPIAGIVNGNPVVLSIMDASALVFVPVAIWLYRHYSKTAFLWLLPLILWSPTTLLFKIWLSLVNGGSLPI